MALSPGSRLGPYDIRAALGAGGMGEVYRAHDPRLARDVALKILAADMAADTARLERFAREARAIAALNHPHIVTIYSTEQADGVRFLTMELIDGQPLDALIPAGGFPLARFLELALPLADALAAAHQKQITHRDLKPANVMVTAEGRVKVLDFGLARIGSPVTSEQTIDATRPGLTSEGTIVGTMPYMSPEQVEGKPLDHRTDLFSLGVMFHEMLTGTRPFTGDSSPQLMSSILRDTPPPVSTTRPDVPEPLARLVQRCLEKRADDRVQTARDVYNELRHVQQQLESGAAPRVTPKSDAGSARSATHPFVLTIVPFTASAAALASDLADGLTHGITVGLSKFSYLSGVRRHSGNEPIATGYLVQGSVRAAGAIVRVVAELSDAPTGQHLWAETYDRPLRGDAFFELQDELTGKIVAAIADVNGALVRAMALILRTKPADALTPYEAVVRSLAYFSLLSPEEHGVLRDALERAVERAPAYADAWGTLAMAYVEEYAQNFNAREHALARARAATGRALELDSSNQLAYFALARIAFFTRDHSALRAASDRLIALNPLATHVLSFLGTATAYMGQWEQGLALCERAMALNPHHSDVYRMPAVIDRFRQRDYAAALELLDRIHLPGFPSALLARAAIYAQLGRLDEALAVWREAETRVPGYGERLHGELTKWFTPELVQHIEEAVDKVRRHAERQPR